MKKRVTKQAIFPIFVTQIWVWFLCNIFPHLYPIYHDLLISLAGVCISKKLDYNLGEEEERSTSMISLTTRRKRGFGCWWRREEEKRGLWWWWVGTPALTDGAWLWWSACMVVVLHDIVKKMKKWQIVVFFKI